MHLNIQRGKSFRQEWINILILSAFLLNLFYFYTSNIFFIKWQFLTPIVLFFALSVQQKTPPKLRPIELFLLGWAIYSLLLFLLSAETKYLNFFIGISCSVILARVRFDYSWVLVRGAVIFLAHHAIFNLIPTYDYVAQFRAVNETWGANRVSFILFFIGLSLFDTHKKFSYFCVLIMFFYTSRLNIIGMLLVITIKNRLFAFIIPVGTMMVVAILTLDTWMFEHYLFKIDYSIHNRIARYLEYFSLSRSNVFLPVFGIEQGAHSLFFELLLNFGFPFIGVFLAIFLYTRKRFFFIIFCIFGSAAKQVNDLGIFYLFLTWFILGENSAPPRFKHKLFIKNS